MSETATFGVVVPTYNAEQHLQRLIESIRNQTNVSCSIVVADQESTDRTVEIARSNGCMVIDIPRPKQSFTGWPQSRNIGAKSIDARILLHLDQDMELGSTDLLEKLEHLIDAQHQAVVIREADIAAGFWPKCKALERSCYHGTEMEAARVVTRELFERVGGYDQDISSGEDYFVTRLYERETQLIRDDSLVLLHYTGRHSLRWMLRKKYLYGRTVKTYLRKASVVQGRSAGSFVLNSLSAYFKNWRLLLKHPALYACIFPLRVLEFSAMQLGMWFGPSASQASTPIRSKRQDEVR